MTDPGGASARAAEALRTRVHRGDRDVPFGELTLADARAQAAELKEVGAWGPLSRVAKVARAWGELARAMEQSGAACVADLEPADVVVHAERLWVLAPPEGLI